MEASKNIVASMSGLEIFASICTTIAVAISGWQIMMHLLNFNESRI
jgi:hypothetical protein